MRIDHKLRGSIPGPHRAFVVPEANFLVGALSHNTIFFIEGRLRVSCAPRARVPRSNVPSGPPLWAALINSIESVP